MELSEQKYGIALTAVGALTLPFFLGIPLLAIGILLLTQGDRVNAQRWIRVLFWIVLAALSVFGILLIVDPMKEGRHSSEGGMAWALLLVTPLCLAILVSLAMAALTLARFQSLSRKDRIMGLGFGGLCVWGGCIALVCAFPWQALGVAVLSAGLSAVVWAGMAWRRRRRAQRSEALRNPPAAVAEPVPTTPVARVPEPPKLPKPPRTRKPVCGMIAWVLLLLAVPIGVLIIYVLANTMDTSDFKGMGAGIAIVGFGIGATMLTASVAAILAIASLRRRERYPGLAVALFVALLVLPFSGQIIVDGLHTAAPAFKELRSAMPESVIGLALVGVTLVGVWLCWRRRKNMTTAVSA